MKNDSHQNNKSNLISYLDDGTFEVLSDGELMGIVGGAEPVHSQPTNSGCNSGCSPTNISC